MGPTTYRGTRKFTHVLHGFSQTRALEETRDAEPPEQDICTLEPPEESPRNGKPHEEVWSIPFDERDPKKVFKIDTLLGVEHEAMLIRVLQEYCCIFAWEPKDIPGVNPSISIHRLCVDPHYKPVKHKKRTFSEEKGEAIREEVGKLLGANAIRKLLFPTWLAKVVLVPKPNGPWRMCSPTSPASTKLARRTATHCPILRDWWTQAQSRERYDHEANLRLNPDKCVFGLTSGNFLGYMISQRRIEPNPKNIEAVEAMESPQMQKYRLTGRIAALM
ncbi:hypothetical protein LIER_09154 [Lithospermum erythrorhizon]|uniref:Uncharacterized protein n=1 Tax=Lithospermum erythrorhizon TaxID=34254 RepID=A0AAV3PFU6_LITER